ncbi:endothelin-converting enzyme homolog [Drosophila eugracilis]|uniref:endothelin-converting enzyme homolog n=1 Tax=Drosophila eugracilis TaxID=29029 RepID=UPI0007E87470|nr:endothelin-converting enzyme homolog [Drosophila eugracilis]
MELPTMIIGLGVILLLLQLSGSVRSQDCARLLENDMDLEEAACENFYQHACGNWYASTMQRNLGAHDMRTKWVASLKLHLIHHLETSSAQHESAGQLATFYNSCLSSGQSVRAYTDAMARSGANFPLLANKDNGSGSPFDWVLANAALRTYGAQGLWRLLVQDNWQSADQRIFYILPPTFDLLGNDGNEMNEFFYERYLKGLLLELGVRVRKAALLAKQIVGFEKSLQILRPNDVEQTLVLRKPQSLRDLEQQLPGLELKRYFETILQGLDWDPSSLLLVADLDYLHGLRRLLARDTTDPMILSTWLLLQLPAHFELRLHDDEKLSSQRDHCLEQLRKLMPGQLGRLQMQLVLGENYQDVYDTSIQQIAVLFRDLKHQFEVVLNETEVFEDNVETRNLARDKLRAMRLLTPRLQEPGTNPAGGQPPTLGGNCDENLMQLSLNQAKLEFRQVFGEPVTSVPADPLSVNAYYRLKLNRIELPLGLMATPLVVQQQCSKVDETMAKLAAGLGYILAHEMVHAFDYDGINYDANGQLANGQWPARAIIRFGLRAGCYLSGRYSNATLTINENIADSEGLRLALDTYRRRNVTNHSLRTFFVTFAQNWCGTAAASALGQHAGHGERVNNVLGNLPEFGETFQCTTTSRMNPVDKCRIW